MHACASIYSTIQDYVSNQKGYTIYMQRWIGLYECASCTDLTSLLPVNPHAPKTATIMQGDKRIYKEIDRHSVLTEP